MRTPVAMLACLWLVGPAAAADKPVVVDLWPGKVPDEAGDIGAELVKLSPSTERDKVEVKDQTRLITNVTKPSVTIYRPANDKDTGAAVLICPGGGYWNLFWELEGEEVAAWLNSVGVTGIVLKYRVPRRPDEPKGVPARRPLQDAQRAVSLVRSKSKEWGIDPERIGIIGFSAGGHLAAATATAFEKRTYDAVDEIDKVSCRPNFAVPVYSGYLKDEIAKGMNVPKGTPPMFICHGDGDLISDPEHSVALYRELRRAGASAELHIYAATGHDYGVRRPNRPYAAWTDACVAWMRDRGFLKPAAKP